MHELKFDYYKEFQILEYLLYPMGQISDELTKKLDHGKIYIEISLYAKFVLTAFSLSKLLPVGATPQKNSTADIASVSTLGRNLIEIYNFFYYLRIDEISNEESEFRRLVANYHHVHENYKIGTKLGANVEELSKYNENVLGICKDKIESHPLFNSMSPAVKKKMLKGESAAYLRRNEITQRYCKNYMLLEALYKIMSNHVHSGIYGFVTSFDRSSFGCDNDNNRDGIANILYLVNYYVGLMIISILMLYPMSKQYIPKECAELIKNLAGRF